MQNRSRLRNMLAVLFLESLFALHMQATEIMVTSIAELQSAIKRASLGDAIILANGTYSDAAVSIATNNITVKAATPGGVFLNGKPKIEISGDYITLSGFQFTSGDIGSAQLVEVSGNHNLLTQLNFNGYHAKTYVVIDGGSQYNEISYCNIENKPAKAELGAVIQIHISPAVIGYHKIRYCSFRNFPGDGGDYGNEPIRIGLGVERDNISRTIVEHCYFDSVGLGDSETISLKSGENICRYNTFTNNPHGMLVFRQGNRNIAYGNFFINGSGGIRIKCGNNHYVYNNYFETGAAPALTLQFVTENPIHHINILHNTFVNMGGITLGGNGPTSVIFANNIFKKSSGDIFSDPNNKTTWAGNIYAGALGIGVTSGMKNTDPKLVKKPDGCYGVSSSSPAIDASSANYSAIVKIANLDYDSSLLLDIDGKARPAAVNLKDVGCDEYTTGTTTNHPMTLSEVGPSYLGGPKPKEDNSDVAAFDGGNALRIAEEWASLVSNADVVRLEKLLGDTYVHIHATGLVESKAEFLEVFKNGSRRYDPMILEDTAVRIFGNTAVVTGKFNLKAFVRGKILEGVNRFGLVLAKTSKGLQVVSFQATSILQVK